MSACVALCQCLQQRFGFLQVGRLKPLGEPAVDRRQQLVGLCTFALLLPEATEAHGGAQFERFRLLAAGDVQGTPQPGFCLCRLCPRLS